MGASDNRKFLVHPWKVIEDCFDPENNEVAESIFSLANEYMGARGNFEEGFAGDTLQGCYLGGIYAKEPQAYIWKRPGFIDYANSMINTTNWLGIRVQVAGEEFSMTSSHYDDYCRKLDMKSGIVSRKLVFTTANGERTALCWERFVSHDDKHLCAVRLSLNALNHSKPVRVSFSLDGTRENSEQFNRMVHCECARKRSDENDQLLLMKIKTTGQFYCHRMFVDNHGVPKRDEAYSCGRREIEYAFSFDPQQGVEYNIDKLVSVWTSRDAGYRHGLIPKSCDSLECDRHKESEIVSFLLHEGAVHIAGVKHGGYDSARMKHIRKVSAIWDRVDIEISGNPAAQQGARYCIFQLLSTLSWRRQRSQYRSQGIHRRGLQRQDVLG